MSIAHAIQEANKTAKVAFGSDISITVARCPHFGNDDTLILVRGLRHREAAAGFARTVKGSKVETIHHKETDWGDGEVTPAYTSSQVSF